MSTQIKSQDTISKTDLKGKLVLLGNFGYNSYKYKYEDYGDIQEEKGVKTYINPRFGLFVGDHLILGLGIGFTFLEKYPQQIITYNDWNKHEGGELETRIISRKDINPSIFLRFQKQWIKKLDYYIDFEAGMDFNLYYKDHQFSYNYRAIESHDLFSNLSYGVILNLTNHLALQSEIISLCYEADFRQNSEKPFTTLNLEYIFSNPNIGLVFYF
jgi:hypothetical protein